MKSILYIILLVLFGCNNQSTPGNQITIKDSVTTENELPVSNEDKPDNSKYHITQDTVVMCTEWDTLKFDKALLNKVIDKHPEFFEDPVADPDFYWYTIMRDPRYRMEEIEFTNEVGRDMYYVLYAYFIRQKNGIDKYALQRKKLIEIYSHINSLFASLQHGGTYFGHQSARILGYAEYSVCLLPKEKDDIEKTYNITKQKELYLKSLRQLIEDEIKIDFITTGSDKIRRNKELIKIVDELDRLITDNFYLRRAQAFHYSNYEYY